jgi:mRNA interferase RelE/StbE
MPLYGLKYASAAEKQIDKLDRQVARRIVAAIERLAHDPRPPGCKQLTGHPGYRVRVGDYRVTYLVDDAATVVSVQRVGHRR